jgi:molybdopterin biosynthesis enzyme
VRAHAEAARTEAVEVDPADAVAAHGAVVAQDVFAHEPMPAFRASVMDGYAVIGMCLRPSLASPRLPKLER